MYPYYETISTREPDGFTIIFEENFTFPAHLHSHMEFVYILEGEVTVWVNDIRKDLEKGDIAVCFPNDIHSYNSSAPSKLIILIFSPDIIRGYLSERTGKTLEYPFFEKGSFGDDINILLDMIVAENSGDRNEYVVKGLLYTIFGKLDRIFVFKDGRQLHDTTIQKLLRYIGSHFNENITLDSIAKDLGFSKFHISRLFNSKIGEQFNDYVNKLRVNMAQSLLTGTDSSISNIALECGFESIRNFNRVFKAYSSMTPKEFRSSRKR